MQKREMVGTPGDKMDPIEWTLKKIKSARIFETDSRSGHELVSVFLKILLIPKS